MLVCAWAAGHDSDTQLWAAGHSLNCVLTPPLLQYWIGGAANTAKISAVFAQLTVGGKWQGPHVFMVRLRDDQGRIMPGGQGVAQLISWVGVS